MGLRGFLFALFFVCITLSCGAASPFGYKYYILKPDSYKGSLDGPEKKDSIPLTVCAPQGGEVNRCIVMMTREAYRLKEEILQLRQQLRDCQRKP